MDNNKKSYISDFIKLTKEAMADVSCNKSKIEKEYENPFETPSINIKENEKEINILKYSPCKQSGFLNRSDLDIDDSKLDKVDKMDDNIGRFDNNKYNTNEENENEHLEESYSITKQIKYDRKLKNYDNDEDDDDEEKFLKLKKNVEEISKINNKNKQISENNENYDDNIDHDKEKFELEEQEENNEHEEQEENEYEDNENRNQVDDEQHEQEYEDNEHYNQENNQHEQNENEFDQDYSDKKIQNGYKTQNFIRSNLNDLNEKTKSEIEKKENKVYQHGIQINANANLPKYSYLEVNKMNLYKQQIEDEEEEVVVEDNNLDNKSSENNKVKNMNNNKVQTKLDKSFGKNDNNYINDHTEDILQTAEEEIPQKTNEDKKSSILFSNSIKFIYTYRSYTKLLLESDKYHQDRL